MPVLALGPVAVHIVWIAIPVPLHMLSVYPMEARHISDDNDANIVISRSANAHFRSSSCCRTHIQWK